MLDYYAGLAADQLDHDGTARGPVDYYLDPNEPPGRWWGAGCPALGLVPGGPVLPEQLRALLEARHPADGRRLGRGFGDRSTRGFDATFSAPKSVSCCGDSVAIPSNASTAHATRDRLYRQAGLAPPAREPVPPVPADSAERMLARLDAVAVTPAGRSLGR